MKTTLFAALLTLLSTGVQNNIFIVFSFVFYFTVSPFNSPYSEQGWVLPFVARMNSALRLHVCCILGGLRAEGQSKLCRQILGHDVRHSAIFLAYPTFNNKSMETWGRRECTQAGRQTVSQAGRQTGRQLWKNKNRSIRREVLENEQSS